MEIAAQSTSWSDGKRAVLNTTMKRLTRSLFSLGLVASLAACGSIPKKTFDVQAIDFDGNRVPCLVVVDRDFKEAVEAQRYTDCEVTVEFRKPRMNIQVVPATRNASGVIVTPDQGAMRPFYEEMREVQITDPRKHLFILRLNPDYIGG